MTNEQRDKHAKYVDIMHAVQSGVAMKMDIDPSETSPKDLRVGINSVMVSDFAMVNLLIDKGIITRDEYLDSLIEVAEFEKKLYEDMLSNHGGVVAKLG